jgi:hypothetical protein
MDLVSGIRKRIEHAKGLSKQALLGRCVPGVFVLQAFSIAYPRQKAPGQHKVKSVTETDVPPLLTQRTRNANSCLYTNIVLSKKSFYHNNVVWLFCCVCTIKSDY